jgi:hypothetical protein
LGIDHIVRHCAMGVDLGQPHATIN